MRKLYQKMDEYFVHHTDREKQVRTAGVLLSGLFYAGYAGLCLWLFFKDRKKLTRVLLVPASCYLTGTLLRAAINAPRPADEISDLKRKDLKKGGKSFPSRHSFSAAVIAAAFAWVSKGAGATAALLAAAMGAERVLEGSHWIRDVIAGLLFGGLYGWLGFFGKDRMEQWRK